MKGATAKARVDSLVPHRGAMSWLDDIVSVDSDTAIAVAHISAERLFTRNGRMSSWLGIEFMAQTVAAWAGHRARSTGRAVSIGFLVGTRRYEVYRQHFSLGEDLLIEVHREAVGDNGLGVFACQITVGDQVAAKANLTVYEPVQQSGDGNADQ